MPIDQNMLSFQKPDAYTPYAAGSKTYGLGASTSPHAGGPLDKSGYQERDMLAQARKDAVLRKMKAMQNGQMMSSAALQPTPGV